MNKAFKQLVWRRANEACEYCRMPQEFYKVQFDIDHIIAGQHGGQTSEDNLALACYRCNLYKGPNLAGIDPVSDQMVRLFHPRHDHWKEHFAWAGAEVLGLSAIGRATIRVLRINHPDYLAVRKALIDEGAFPP